MGKTRYSADDGSIARARARRKDQTPAEKRLWSALRGSALGGRKFKREQRIGPYYGDLVCLAERLVIEADGETHATEEARHHDARRTAFMEREGYRVMRFSNADIMTNLEGVIEVTCSHFGPSPSHSASPSGPLPLPRGERSL